MRLLMLSAALAFASSAHALDGEVLVHDPSTVIEQAGRYYAYGTGNGLPILVSDDGWTWRRARLADVGGARRQARPRSARPRRQQHLGARRHPHRRQLLRLLLRAGHAAEVRDRIAGRPHARSGIA